MKTNAMISFTLTLAMGLLVSLATQAQVDARFIILDQEGALLHETTQRLYHGNTLVDQETHNRARNSWKLEFDSYYTLEIVKKGFVTKRIGIYTPPIADAPGMQHIEFFVEMEPERKFDRFRSPEVVLDYPAAILEFNRETGAFVYNETYYVSTRRDFARLRASRYMLQ